MLRYKLGPVTIGARRHYTDPADKAKPFAERRPMTRKDGTIVEYVDFFVPDEAEPRSITLDPAVNGSLPAEGEIAVIEVVETVRAEARVSAAGRPYIDRRAKRRAVAFTPAKAAA